MTAAMTTLTLRVLGTGVRLLGGPTRGPGLAQALESCLRTLDLWHMRARTRRELGELDDRLLKDIGITREQARQEAGKPFWRE